MTNLLLYLVGERISVRRIVGSIASVEFRDGRYSIEDQYFGDWIPLRDRAGRIMGFKIVPLVDDNYLRQRFLATNFVTRAHNLRVQAGKDTYILISLTDNAICTEDQMNRIEAAILRSPSGNVAIRLDGFTKEEVDQFAFGFE